MGMQNIRIAQSCATQARQAAAEFYESVVQPDMELVVFFCSSEYDLDALAAEIDRAVEHRPAGVEHVNVGGRASVDRQERRPDRVGAGLSGREADRAVFALGAGMEGQAARFPADVGHRPRLR